MLLGCIGDDFTGSSDLANTLCKAGMRVIQYVGIPNGKADASVEAGVVSLKSRTINSAEAVRQSLAALDWLRAQGCQQFVFKYCSTFDSTPQGNIGPVCDALAEALDASKVIVCPAFPGTGRSIYQGHLFVGDVLLSESGMQHHPLTPMTDSDIRRWLSLQTGFKVGHIAYADVSHGSARIALALEREDRAGHRLVVVDAITDDDLVEIARAADGLPLVTGGSGIAQGLPANFRARGVLSGAQARWVGATGPAAILSGSCSLMTRKQIDAHIVAGQPAFEVTAQAAVERTLSADTVADWVLTQAGGVPLVYSSADPETVKAAQKKYGREESAAAIETLFADLASRLAREGIQRLIVAGGETSGAVVGALGLAAMEIGPEIAAGVPALKVEGGELRLALKSGNFGGEDFFARAADVLGHSSA